jgi:two-component system chemotaxis response regulator CheB
MPHRDIVVVGASAGGIEALRELFAGLPPNFGAPVFVVLHLPAEAGSMLPEILSRAGPLPAVNPQDGDPILPGRVYVAPPDQHLLLEPGRVRLQRGPKEHRHRPAVDPLFRTAARAYGDRVVGVILTGALDDGTAGLLEIKKAGGLAVVQDPAGAVAPGMPRSALANVEVDHKLRLREIAPLLTRIVAEPASADVETHDGPRAALTASRSRRSRRPRTSAH